MNRMVLLMICAVLLSANAWSADAVRQEKLELVQGAPLKKLSGKIKGYESVVYSVFMPAGGLLKLQLKSSNRSSYFNITADGANEALFIGSRDGDHFAGAVPVAGVYKINVYLMRNAARRNEVASFVLEAGSDANQGGR